MLVNETYVFVVVVKAGSLSKAAKQLGLSVAGVGKAIDRLEAHFDVKLLNRTTRSVNMTEYGIQLFQKTESLPALFQDAENHIIQSHSNPRGRIKLGAPPAFAEIILSKILPEFLNLYTEIDVELHLEKRRTYPEPGEYELLIKAGSLPDHAKFRSKPLVQWRRVICASPEYLRKNGTPLKPEDLEQHTCLDYNYRDTGRIWHLYKSINKNGKTQKSTHKLKLKTNIDTDAGMFILACAKNHGGIIHVPAFTVQEDILLGRLVPLLKDHYVDPIQVYFVHTYHPKAVPKKIKLLMEYIQKRIDEIDYNNISLSANKKV